MKRFFCFVLVFPFICFSLQAQTTKKHTHNETFMGVPNTTVTYSYYLDEYGHEMKHGVFQATGNDTETSVGWESGTKFYFKTIRKVNYTATFKKGLLHGDVRIIKEVIEMTNGTVTSKEKTDYKYRFDNGSIISVDDSSMKDGQVTWRLVTSIHNGRRTGKYKYFLAADRTDITGEFNQEGKINGHWVIKTGNDEVFMDAKNGCVTSYAFFKHGRTEPYNSMDKSLTPIAEAYANGKMSLDDLMDNGYCAVTRKDVHLWEKESAMPSVLTWMDVKMESFQVKEEIPFVRGRFPFLVFDRTFVVRIQDQEQLIKNVRSDFFAAWGNRRNPNEEFSAGKSIYANDIFFTMEQDGSCTYCIKYDGNPNRVFLDKLIGESAVQAIIDETSVFSRGMHDMYFHIPATILTPWLKGQHDKITLRLYEEEKKRKESEKEKERERLEQIRIAKENEEMQRRKEEEERQRFLKEMAQVNKKFLDDFLQVLLQTGKDDYREPILSYKNTGSGTDIYDSPLLGDIKKRMNLSSQGPIFQFIPILDVQIDTADFINRTAVISLTVENSNERQFDVKTVQTKVLWSNYSVNGDYFLKQLKTVHSRWDDLKDMQHNIDQIDNELSDSIPVSAESILESYKNYRDSLNYKITSDYEDSRKRISDALNRHVYYQNLVENYKSIERNDSEIRTLSVPYKALSKAFKTYSNGLDLSWNGQDSLHKLKDILKMQSMLLSALKEGKGDAYNLLVKNKKEVSPEQWFSISGSTLYLDTLADGTQSVSMTPVVPANLDTTGKTATDIRDESSPSSTETTSSISAVRQQSVDKSSAPSPRKKGRFENEVAVSLLKYATTTSNAFLFPDGSVGPYESKQFPVSISYSFGYRTSFGLYLGAALSGLVYHDWPYEVTASTVIDGIAYDIITLTEKGPSNFGLFGVGEIKYDFPTMGKIQPKICLGAGSPITEVDVLVFAKAGIGYLFTERNALTLMGGYERVYDSSGGFCLSLGITF